MLCVGRVIINITDDPEKYYRHSVLFTLNIYQCYEAKI